ncbi:MAG TPA: hypothetical protein VHA09_02465 [Nitrososphaera sp.]|nr:hypothetical protein [Nitrososphaera sp.]
MKKTRKTGTLTEFATSYLRDHEGTFGIIEMDGFRLIGAFDNDGDNGDKGLRKGMKVRMDRCGISAEGSPFYHFSPLSAN